MTSSELFEKRAGTATSQMQSAVGLYWYTALFYLGVSHWKRFWLVCTSRSAI